MLIFLLLGMTWLSLFFLTGNKTPWGMFDREKAEGETIVSLGNVTEWALTAEKFFIRRLIVDGLSEP